MGAEHHFRLSPEVDVNGGNCGGAPGIRCQLYQRQSCGGGVCGGCEDQLDMDECDICRKQVTVSSPTKLTGKSNSFRFAAVENGKTSRNENALNQTRDDEVAAAAAEIVFPTMADCFRSSMPMSRRPLVGGVADCVECLECLQHAAATIAATTSRTAVPDT